MCCILGSSQAIGQTYNVSGDRYVTLMVWLVLVARQLAR